METVAPFVLAVEPDASTQLTTETFDIARHNGRVTISNPQTGQHRTFAITTVTNEASGLHGKRIVALLTGPDNENDYTGFAFADEHGRVTVWKRFRGESGTKSQHEKFASLLQFPATWSRRGLVYQIEGRCRRCNSPLTHPQSIASGLGPICAEKGDL